MAELVVIQGGTPLWLYSLVLKFKNATFAANLCNIPNAKGEDVVFNGVSYRRHNIEVNQIVEAINAGTACKLRLGNANNACIDIIRNQKDFLGGEVKITRSLLEFADVVNFDNPPTTAGQLKTILDAKFLVVQIKDVTRDELSLELVTVRDLKHKVPNKEFGWRCSNNFKDNNCGYVGSETSCDLSLARCRQLNNEVKFNGIFLDRSKYAS